MSIEYSIQKASHILVAKAACLKKNSSVLVICGLHNKVFAEYIAVGAYQAGSYPFIWVFDEDFFEKNLKNTSSEVIAVVPRHVRSLIGGSDVVVWLSQFEDIERVSTDIRESIYSFWGAVYEVVKCKPRLQVNLPSAKYLENIGIDHDELLRVFVSAVNVDYKKLGRTGSEIASRLRGKGLVRVYDLNGTDLRFNIDDRRVGVEAGTLEGFLQFARELKVEIPAGEAYVAPVETSAEGTLVVDEVRECNIRGLELCFEGGRIVSYSADEGCDTFESILEKAEGDKDKIAEMGVVTNHGMRPIGWTPFDEKALGTAHIAIGDNADLGGVNRASIHMDFVLYNPTITADDEVIIMK